MKGFRPLQDRVLVRRVRAEENGGRVSDSRYGQGETS
jgi:co-chaperonin GroES (HSP10)